MNRKDTGVGVSLVYCLCTWVILICALIRLIYLPKKKKVSVVHYEALSVLYMFDCIPFIASLQYISEYCNAKFPSLILYLLGMDSLAKHLRFIHVSLGKFSS